MLTIADTPVGFTATHLPFNVPKKYWDLYDREALKLSVYREAPKNSPEWVKGDSEPVQYYTKNGYSKPWKASEEESIELLHGHYATLSYIDAQVGRIINKLEKQNMLDNTIVIVTSDHGYHESEHGYWGKHNCWDKSFQIPLLIRLPDQQSNIFSGLSEHVDIYPTLCSLAGIPIPNFCSGKNLFDSLEKGYLENREAVFGMRKPQWHDRLQEYEKCQTVRTLRYRLNTYYDENEHVLYHELFDYDVDPYERTNYAGQFPEIVKELEHMYVNEVII